MELVSDSLFFLRRVKSSDEYLFYYGEPYSSNKIELSSFGSYDFMPSQDRFYIFADSSAAFESISFVAESYSDMFIDKNNFTDRESQYSNIVGFSFWFRKDIPLSSKVASATYVGGLSDYARDVNFYSTFGLESFDNIIEYTDTDSRVDVRIHIKSSNILYPEEYIESPAKVKMFDSTTSLLYKMFDERVYKRASRRINKVLYPKTRSSISGAPGNLI